MRFCWRVLIMVMGASFSLSNVASAELNWQNPALTCSRDDSLGSIEIDAWLETNPEEEPIPDACLVGHWRLDPKSYPENVWRMTEGRDILYDRLDLAAEFVVQDNGIAKGCLSGQMAGNFQVRGKLASFEMQMQGASVAILRKDAALAELFPSAFDSEFYRMRPIMDGVTATGSARIDTVTVPIDVVPLPIFPTVSADVRCGRDEMTVVTYPKASDFIEHRYVRIR